MKSLNTFPSQKASFDVKAYGHDVRQACAASSPYSGDFGLELELEGRGLPARYGGLPLGRLTWVAHEDGSLRNGGMEYVLSQPCSKAEVEPLVDNLFEYLRSVGARISNTTRCSTHVHLNMKNVKINELAAFVSLWGIFEDVLSNWCGGHRSGNHFALRFSDCDWAVSSWVSAFRTGIFEFSRERRYLALNAACLQTFGSLEVRTMRGAETTAEIIEWVEMLDLLRTAAKTFRDPTAIAATFSGDGANAFAVRVFGQDIVDRLTAASVELEEDFDRLIRCGFRRIQPIVYSLPWDTVLPEIERVFIPNPFEDSPLKKVRFRG